MAVVSHQPCKFVTCWCNRICELVRLFVQASEGVGGGVFSSQSRKAETSTNSKWKNNSDTWADLY